MNVLPSAAVTVFEEWSLCACVRWNALCSRMLVAKLGSFEWTLPPAYGIGSIAVAKRFVAGRRVMVLAARPEAAHAAEAGRPDDPVLVDVGAVRVRGVVVVPELSTGSAYVYGCSGSRTSVTNTGTPLQSGGGLPRCPAAGR